MGKNAKTKAKFKPIVVELPKATFRKLVKNHLKFISSNGCCNILTGLNFKILGNKLAITSTDGMSLLQSTIEIEENVKEAYEITLNGVHLYKAKFARDYMYSLRKTTQDLDLLTITFNAENAEILDELNGIKYIIPPVYGKFPETEKLIPKKINEESYIQIGFNTQILSRLNELPDDRDCKAVFNIRKSDAEVGAMVVCAKDRTNGISYKTLVMPVLLKDRGQND